MTDLRPRLERCFATAFPELPPDHISQATQSSVANWDSIASITLIAVIEEEFGITIDFELVPELTSFQKIEEYLSTH